MSEQAPASRDSIEFKKPIEVHTTPIEGLLWVDKTVNDDKRGWFQEAWHKDKMAKAGVPDFEVRQFNISSSERGGTRGLHAEPWEKFVTVTGNDDEVFGVWADLREGSATYKKTFSMKIDASIAVYVPRGVANGFQSLGKRSSMPGNIEYAYIVSDNWSEEAQSLYTYVNLADPELGIDWPIPLNEATISDKDKLHPYLADVVPMKPRKTLVTGANGQLGKALRSVFPEAEFVDRATFDISDESTWGNRNWRQYGTVINAAAFTKVDAAETPEGKIEAWNTNALAPRNLAQLAIENHLVLVGVSTDYVYNGTEHIHTEDEPFSPLGFYGQSKAAGDSAMSVVPKHYDVRTSWVVGDGPNFVRTMATLAENGTNPPVVDDQFGRPTFTEDLAKGIKHLLETKAPYGTYNLSNEGPVTTWNELAKKVFELTGNDPARVGTQTTEEFIAKKVEGGSPVSPRPLQSTLDLAKIEATGFVPRDWRDGLTEYLAN